MAEVAPVLGAPLDQGRRNWICGPPIGQNMSMFGTSSMSFDLEHICFRTMNTSTGRVTLGLLPTPQF